MLADSGNSWVIATVDDGLAVGEDQSVGMFGRVANGMALERAPTDEYDLTRPTSGAASKTDELATRVEKSL